MNCPRPKPALPVGPAGTRLVMGRQLEAAGMHVTRGWSPRAAPGRASGWAARRVIMAEWFYLEQVLADRARDLAEHVAKAAALRSLEAADERPVLSAGLAGWSSARASQVGGLVALALAGTVGLPAGILGAVWTIRRVVELLLR